MLTVDRSSNDYVTQFHLTGWWLPVEVSQPHASDVDNVAVLLIEGIAETPSDVH